MDALGAYSSLLLPVVVALLVVVVLVKIMIAIEHAIVRIATGLLTIIVLVGVLIAGTAVVGRASAIKNVATATVQTLTGSGQHMPTSAAALTRALDRSARQALVGVGLNPAYLSLRVSCTGARAQVHLGYRDRSFFFGALSHQDVTVPWPNSVRCSQ